jgi:hypothetical protein
VTRQLARRHRRERLAGVLIALIGVAVLVVAIVALRNPKKGSIAAGTPTRTVTTVLTPPASRSSSKSPTGSTSQPSASAPTSTSSPTTAIGSKPLIVLNDTRTPNLAGAAAARFESGGWKVTSFDENYSNDIASTAAYYDPAVSGAKKAAKALQNQYPTIKRVVPRFPELPAGPVVVVLTADYSPN